MASVAEAKAEPSSPTGAEGSSVAGGPAASAEERANEGPPRVDPLRDPVSDEADEGWPGPIDEPPPLLAA